MHTHLHNRRTSLMFAPDDEARAPPRRQTTPGRAELAARMAVGRRAKTRSLALALFTNCPQWFGSGLGALAQGQLGPAQAGRQLARLPAGRLVHLAGRQAGRL
jgi:hypothetical protein